VTYGRALGEQVPDRLVEPDHQQGGDASPSRRRENSRLVAAGDQHPGQPEQTEQD